MGKIEWPNVQFEIPAFCFAQTSPIVGPIFACVSISRSAFLRFLIFQRHDK